MVPSPSNSLPHLTYLNMTMYGVKGFSTGIRFWPLVLALLLIVDENLSKSNNHSDS